MAFPLIALAATVLPEIVRLVAGDRAGTAASKVGDAVRATTGTDDPVAAKAKLDQDPQAAAQLRTRLAEIAVEEERLRLDAEEKRRAADLAELRERLGDTQDARDSMLRLSANKDPMRWGPAVVSVIVTLMFTLALLVFTLSQWFSVAENNRELVNIILGALVAAFTAVINFWIGSSQGSREKDATVRALQEHQTRQAAAALTSQTEQASAALTGQTQATQAAITSLRQVAEAARIAPKAAPAPMAKSRAFEAAVELVLDKEGGYSNNPLDRGGPTNFGITLRTYAAFHGIDPSTVTEQMMRDLNREEAIEIYRSNYWNAACCDRLPPGVDLCVFDFGVNAGVRRAVQMLQEVVGVAQDGSIGPITLSAVAACDPADVVRRYAEKRLAFYRSLADFDAFGRGWTTRVVAIRDSALRLAAGPQTAIA